MKSVRIAAHVHSSWSYDAEWSLADIARVFRRRRYEVVLMSEHDREFNHQRWAEYQKACEAASTGGILLIPGIEYEDIDNVVHTPVWGDDVPFLGSARPTIDLLQAAQAEGAVAVFAHPWRRNAISRYQPEWAELLSAVEVWNRKYDGVAPHQGSIKFANDEGLAPFVSLDFHTSRQLFPLAMSLSLPEPPTQSSIIEAIRKGLCSAEFLGFSALRFTRGLEGATLHALEVCRRGIRDRLHQAQGTRHLWRLRLTRDRTCDDVLARKLAPAGTPQQRLQCPALGRISGSQQIVHNDSGAKERCRWPIMILFVVAKAIDSHQRGQSRGPAGTAILMTDSCGRDIANAVAALTGTCGEIRLLGI
jgi:hypothetical protein